MCSFIHSTMNEQLELDAGVMPASRADTVSAFVEPADSAGEAVQLKKNHVNIYRYVIKNMNFI